jgi:hypothetical protein
MKGAKLMKMNKSQIQLISSFIDLVDVKNFVFQHPELLNEYENQRDKLSKTKDNSPNRKKIFPTLKNNYVIWNCYPYLRKEYKKNEL